MHIRKGKQKTKKAKTLRVLWSLLLVGILMMAFSITSQALEGDETSSSPPTTTETQQEETSGMESVSESQGGISESQTESSPESWPESDSSLSEEDVSEVESDIEAVMTAFSAGQATVSDGAEFAAAFNEASVSTILLAADI